MASDSTFETVDLEYSESNGNTPKWMQNRVGDGSLDYRGRCADKTKTGGWRAGIFIHLLLTGDAAAIIGIAGNVVPYLLTFLHMPFTDAVNSSSNFMGIAYILPIFWGYLADTYLGPFMTIAASSVICFSGLLILFLSVTLPSLKPEVCVPIEGVLCPEASQPAVSWFLSGLYLTAIGSAGLLPCSTSMGQDQFDDTDPVEKKRGSYFFTSFYANVNVTAVFCVTVLYWIQTDKGYNYGYGAILGMYFFGVVCFFIGTPLYRHREPAGSAFTRVGQVFVGSFMNMRKTLPEDHSDLFELDDEVAMKKGIRKIAHTDRLRFLDKAAIVPPVNTLAPEDMKSRVCTITQVEELKTVIQILPIWLCCISVYTIFAQLMGVTLGQALSMDRRMGSVTIPAGSTVAIMMITATCVIFIYELILVPILRKITGHPQGISDLKRMGTALFLALLAMVAAALVESKRVKIIKENNVTYLELQTGTVLPMRFYWLFPQFQLLGAVEFLLGVAQLNFFYSQTPDSMRGLATSLYFSSVSIGYFTSTVLVEAVNRYTRHEGGWLNPTGQLLTGGLTKFYYLLATIMIVNFLAFLLFSHWYTYKKVIEESDHLPSWKLSEDDQSHRSKDSEPKVEGAVSDPFSKSGTGDDEKVQSADDNVLRISMNETSPIKSPPIQLDDKGIPVIDTLSMDEAAAMSPGFSLSTKSDRHLDSPARTKSD